MIRKLMLFAFLAASMAGVAFAQDQHWLHIRVDESGPDGETVRVNLPLELVTELLPMIEAEGKEGFHMGLGKDHDVDFPKLIRALRKAKDGQYVTVEGNDETVRVTKKDDYLLVHVVDKDETVNIRMRLAIVDALFSGEDGKLNFEAAALALQQEGESELVRVDGEDETVRIWIDQEESID